MEGFGSTRFNAAGVVATSFGVLSGLGGVRHAVGELLQGRVPAQSLIIDSWTQGPLATNMGGEPAFTLAPNLFSAGILTLVVSLAVILWSIAWVHKVNGGWGLLLLVFTMFLVGGGFGPPIIGLLAGVAGLAINARHRWWLNHAPASLQHWLARLWPWLFAICLANGLFLFIASLVLVIVFDVNRPELFLNSFYFAVLSLLACIVSAIAYDAQRLARHITPRDSGLGSGGHTFSGATGG